MRLNKVKKYFTLSTLKAVWEGIKYYAVGLYNRIDDHHLFLNAGGLAFSLFASIIPFTLIAFSILGNLLDNESVEEQVSYIINTIIPYPQYANYAYNVIISRVPEVVQYKTIAGYIGVFSLLFIASGLFSSMRTILNKIFNVTKEKHMLIGKLRDLGMVILLVIFLLLAIVVLPLLNILIGLANDSEFLAFLRIGDLPDVLISIGSTLIILWMFFIFYKLIPYDKIKKRVSFVSAVSATILWEMARQVFGYYISHIATLDRIYGTYALVVVVAFWVYYSSILFLIGAEIGQLYRERLTELERVSYEKT